MHVCIHTSSLMGSRVRGRVRVYNISWGASTINLCFWLRPQNILYTLTRPLTREPIGIEVWMRISAEYFTLNEGWLRFETVTSCHVGFDTTSRDHITLNMNVLYFYESGLHAIWGWIAKGKQWWDCNENDKDETKLWKIMFEFERESKILSFRFNFLGF